MGNLISFGGPGMFWLNFKIVIELVTFPGFPKDGCETTLPFGLWIIFGPQAGAQHR